MVSRETGGKAAFILFCKFLIGKELHYNVLISAIQQCESLISIHMSPPSWTSFPPSAPSHFSRMLQSTRLSSMCYTSNFPLAVLHMVMCMFQCYSLNLSTFSFPTVPTSVSTSAFLVLGRGFPGGSDDKESACNAGETGLIPGSGRSPGEGNGSLFQYSCLENPMDRENYGVQSMNWQRIRHDWATN